MEAAGFSPKSRCCVCDKYLSVPPVYISEKGSTCGRCPPQGCRNESYEELAKLLKFPCFNEGCTEKLSWGAASQHEQVCQHQLICCPFAECKKEFKLLAIKSHFEVNHKDRLVWDELNVRDLFKNAYKSFKKEYLVIINDMPLLVVMKSIWQKFRNFAEWEYNFGVFNMSPAASDIQYDIVLTFSYDDGFHISSSLNSLQMKSFNNVSHTFTDDAFLTHKMSNIDKHSDITVDVTVGFKGMELENAKRKDKKMREYLDELQKLFKCELCKNRNPERYCTPLQKIKCNSCLHNCPYYNNPGYHVMQNEFQALAEAIDNLKESTISVTNEDILGLKGFVNCSYNSPTLINMKQYIEKILLLKVCSEKSSNFGTRRTSTKVLPRANCMRRDIMARSVYDFSS